MSQSCGRCKSKFETIEEYDLHLVGCVLRARMFRHQQFRAVETRDPLIRQRAVMRKPDYVPAERARLGHETEVDAVDAGLRTGRIPSEPYDAPTLGNWWRRWKAKEHWWQRVG